MAETVYCLKNVGAPSDEATSFPGSLFSASIVVEKRMEAEKRDPGNEVGDEKGGRGSALHEKKLGLPGSGHFPT